MRRVRKPINQINVVLYIDVMLVLLVIFMVTAPLITPGEIELPSVGSKLTAPADPLTVQLAGDKALTLQDGANGPKTRVTREQLVARLLDEQTRKERPVVIAADGKQRYEDVVALLDLLQRNGVKKVGLLARPAS